MLGASDVRVVGDAGTAREALRLIEARSPNVVLIVADENATDLLRRIKEKSPKVSVIILDGDPGPSDVSRAIAAGCSGYLHKRVGRVELVRAIRGVARGECIVEPGFLKGLLEEVARQQAAAKPGRPEGLTVYEREVLRLITEGQTNRQIAQRLGYKVGTVKDYVQKIIRKLEVSDRTQAAVKAVRLKLLD